MNKTIIDLLKFRVPGLELVYLFGSEAEGRAGRESDVDIAYLSTGIISAVERFAVSNEIACALNRDVDLLDLRSASEVMKVQVISKGKNIFCSDATRKGYFEMYALSDYARLNEERRESLERVIRGGRNNGD